MRSIGEALKDAEVLLLAVPGHAVPDVVTEQGAALAGKVVMDAVNRMGAPMAPAEVERPGFTPSGR